MNTKRFFGSDPEFFIYKDLVKTKFGEIPDIIPPASLIADMGVNFTVSNNNKRVLLDTDAYKWIEDGSALELNFKTPIESSGSLNRLTNSAMSSVRDFLYKLDVNLKLSKNVLGYFDTKKYWEGRSKDFIDCVRFGCDPDVFPKLYEISGFEEETCKIVDASKHEYRYAGGHIHIQNMSKDSDIYLNNLELAPIVLDFLIGTTNIILERDKSIVVQEKARLKYYGRPGRVRLQKYSDKVNGIEYRPPSNQWIGNPYNINSILESANIACNIIESGFAPKFFETFKDKIYVMWDALTKHDKVIAKDLLSDSLVWLLDNNFTTLKELEGVYGTF